MTFDTGAFSHSVVTVLIGTCYNGKSMRTETIAAIGVGLEALVLCIWSITALVSGLSGETVVTEDW